MSMLKNNFGSLPNVDIAKRKYILEELNPILMDLVGDCVQSCPSDPENHLKTT